MGYYIPQGAKSEANYNKPQMNMQYDRQYSNPYQNYSHANYNEYQNFNNPLNLSNASQQRGNSRNQPAQINNSVSYEPNLEMSFNNSFASESGWNGAPEVGRFGGKKKKNRELDTSMSSNTQTKRTEPKVKQPTIKEESSN